MPVVPCGVIRLSNDRVAGHKEGTVSGIPLPAAIPMRVHAIATIVCVYTG